MYNPMMALLIGIVLLTVVLVFIWPRAGVIARWRRLRQVTDRVRREDAIKHIFVASNNGQRATLQTVAGALEISGNEASELVFELEQSGLERL